MANCGFGEVRQNGIPNPRLRRRAAVLAWAASGHVDCSVRCPCAFLAQHREFTSAAVLDAAGIDMLYLGLLTMLHMLLTIGTDAIRNSPYVKSVLFSGALQKRAWMVGRSYAVALLPADLLP